MHRLTCTIEWRECAQCMHRFAPKRSGVAALFQRTARCRDDWKRCQSTGRIDAAALAFKAFPNVSISTWLGTRGVHHDEAQSGATRPGALAR
ncbi:MAG: hypothetical protein ABL964_06800 [Steroidobacteraceae bacterium]